MVTLEYLNGNSTKGSQCLGASPHGALVPNLLPCQLGKMIIKRWEMTMKWHQQKHPGEASWQKRTPKNGFAWKWASPKSHSVDWLTGKLKPETMVFLVKNQVFHGFPVNLPLRPIQWSMVHQSEIRAQASEVQHADSVRPFPSFWVTMGYPVNILKKMWKTVDNPAFVDM